MLKSILRNWYRYVLWALISLVFWSWVVVRVTDTIPARKVVLYADLPALDGEGLELKLEEDMPEGIRFVKAHAFEYAMFNQQAVLKGDLFLVSDRFVDEFIESFVPIDPAAFPGASFYEKDGVAYGVCVYDEAAGLCTAGDYVTYLAGERCYLFFNAESMHLGAWNGSSDDAAIAIAQQFLGLR